MSYADGVSLGLSCWYFSDMRGTFQQGLTDCEQFMKLLHELSDMGAVMRDVITSTILDADLYASLTKCTSHCSVIIGLE